MQWKTAQLKAPVTIFLCIKFLRASHARPLLVPVFEIHGVITIYAKVQVRVAIRRLSFASQCARRARAPFKAGKGNDGESGSNGSGKGHRYFVAVHKV